MANKDDLLARLQRSLRAGTRGLILTTTEEHRALLVFEQLGDFLDCPVHTWSAASGVDHDQQPIPLAMLLTRIVHNSNLEIWLLLDGALAASESVTRRSIREFCQRSHGPVVVFVGEQAGHLVHVPELVELELPLADLAEIRQEIIKISERLLPQNNLKSATQMFFEQQGHNLAQLCLGLPTTDIQRLIHEAILQHEDALEKIPLWIAKHKSDFTPRQTFIERIDESPNGLLGGLNSLKSWLKRRALALRPTARNVGIPYPRGILLIGVQGCGKSLAARVSASLLNLPLCRLELGRLFGGTVGESEANLRKAIHIVERMAPIVLWIDEIDKGIAGVEGAASDGGTAARVLGGLLTWMQERQNPVFMVMTANRIDLLPPELLRRGRLDEIFFVDLPTADERTVILDVHLTYVPQTQLGYVPPLADSLEAFAELAHNAEGYSGAELESALIEARISAFSEDRPLAAGDFDQALQATIPLSRTRAEDITALRSWAKNRARRA